MIARLKKIAHFLLAHGAYWYYGRPARALIVVGVTGTKGKSSTCRYIASALEAGGFKVGLLSTAEFQIGEKRWLNDKKMTMLGRGQIQRMLRDMVRAGCRYAVVETSSEGILQYRHVGLNYDIAVFTNLGTEHSERHGGFENLRRDKGKMFAALAEHPPKMLSGTKVPRVIVVNADDAQAHFYLQYTSDLLYTYTMHEGVQFAGSESLAAAQVRAEAGGMSWKVGGSSFHVPQPGVFNVYNALAAIAVAKSQGVSDDKIGLGLQNVVGIPGRMEYIREGQPFQVVVDYAHESLSYRALFETLREMAAQTHGRIIAIIGSDGGGRDIRKRPEMGAVAGRLCDVVVVTDVNCFDEDPRAIAEMLATGARAEGKEDGKDLFIEVDRRKAIELAFSMAKEHDVVAITAKGTEPVICVANGEKIPWDDRAVAREFLKPFTKPVSA